MYSVICLCTNLTPSSHGFLFKGKSFDLQKIGHLGLMKFSCNYTPFNLSLFQLAYKHSKTDIWCVYTLLITKWLCYYWLRLNAKSTEIMRLHYSVLRLSRIKIHFSKYQQLPSTTLWCISLLFSLFYAPVYFILFYCILVHVSCVHFSSSQQPTYHYKKRDHKRDMKFLLTRG